MNIVISFVVGLTFGLGLIVSGMGNPAKVLAFLDLSGNWDPSLMLVMGGAVAVAAIAFSAAARRTTSLLGRPLLMPTARQIDRPLVVGSALFGIGWGLAGICPGPALVLLGTGATKAVVFVLALLGGMALFELRQRRSQSAQK